MNCAVILAAGNSRRMGCTKALLDINGRTFVEQIIDRLDSSGFRHRYIVLGENYDEVSQTVNLMDCNIIRNEYPERGQLYSLQLAISNLWLDHAGMMVTLVDHPLVTIDTYRQMNLYIQANPHQIIVPRFSNRKGHPVFFPERVFRKLMSTPLAEGARTVVNDPKEEVLYLDVEDEGILQDIDTPEKYEQIIGPMKK